MRRALRFLSLGLALLAGSLPAAPRPEGRYRLTDVRSGATVTAKSYSGKAQFIFFGFTHCRLTCPLGLQAMAAALKALGPEAKRLAPLFITIDPERDTPQELAAYAAQFSPAITPLRGSTQATQSALRAFRLQAERFGDKDPAGYQYDHPSLFYLLDRQGRYVKTLSSRSAPADLARELRAALTSPAL